MNNIENDFYIKPLLEFLYSKDSIIDIELIKKAAYFAKKYHGIQKRKSGEPYYSHPVEVAILLAENCFAYMQNYFTTETIAAALLHDTIEDTELTLENLKLEFGEIIATYVEDLTRIKTCGKKITAGESIEKLFIEGKTSSIIIKMFDRIHNLQTINAKSEKSIKKTVDETLKDFIPILITLETPELLHKLTELCYKSLNVNIIDFTYKNIINIKDNSQPLSLTLKNEKFPK
jgi:(p)ppGpp synthase/HD superfamily hydrolase